MMETIKELGEFFKELGEFLCWGICGIIKVVSIIGITLFVFCIMVGVVVVLSKLGSFIWINTSDILETNKILDILNL